jgi:hypothetical protein
MRGYGCPNDVTVLAAGGTGCVDGSHDNNATYESEASRNQARLDYPSRGKGKGKGKGNGRNGRRAKGAKGSKGDKAGKGAEHRTPASTGTTQCHWDQLGSWANNAGRTWRGRAATLTRILSTPPPVPRRHHRQRLLRSVPGNSPSHPSLLPTPRPAVFSEHKVRWPPQRLQGQ